MNQNYRPTPEPGRRRERSHGVDKAELQSFFHGEWPRLRRMIMDMEEQGWDLVKTTDPEFRGDPDSTLITEQISASFSESSDARESDQEHFADSGNRLSSLAAQINRRLSRIGCDEESRND